MRDTDKNKFLEIILAFAAIKERELSEPVIELYWQALKEHEFRFFHRAVIKGIKSEWVYFPTPAEITRLIADEQEREERLIQEMADNQQVIKFCEYRRNFYIQENGEEDLDKFIKYKQLRNVKLLAILVEGSQQTGELTEGKER